MSGLRVSRLREGNYDHFERHSCFRGDCDRVLRMYLGQAVSLVLSGKRFTDPAAEISRLILPAILRGSSYKHSGKKPN
jgi:hypothetical protein